MMVTVLNGYHVSRRTFRPIRGIFCTSGLRQGFQIAFQHDFAPDVCRAAGVACQAPTTAANNILSEAGFVSRS